MKTEKVREKAQGSCYLLFLCRSLSVGADPIVSNGHIAGSDSYVLYDKTIQGELRKKKITLALLQILHVDFKKSILCGYKHLQ